MSKSDALNQSLDTPEGTDDLEHDNVPSFGWNSYSELVNGRVAMLAILGLVLLEWFSKQDLFTWLGLR